MAVKSKVKQWVSDNRVIVAIYLLLSLAVSAQALLLGKKAYVEGQPQYNKYNNYTIFERSFYHLEQDQNLYVLYPKEHHDLFKYSPSFSALFSVFAVFPDWIGLNLWNIVNAFSLLVAVYCLSQVTNYQKGLILLLCLIDLMGSMQNEQSNGLMAGLMVLGFALLEKKRYLLATLCLMITVYVKLFGIVAFALCVFYPKKGTLILYSILWAVVLFMLPLLFTSADQYSSQLIFWKDLLENDHSASYGYSVMGVMQTWFGIVPDKQLIVLVGAIAFLAPLLRVKQYTNYTFRYLMMASVLLWVVVFNHKAESPTFIIAMTGVALWFVVSDKNIANVTLFALACILTTLSPTDIFPKVWRKEFVDPYVLKALPCILIWGKVVYDMLVLKEDHITENDSALNVPDRAVVTD